MDLLHTLYEPAGAGPHPTILALHGLGASAFDLLALAPRVAGGRCRMICPQGPLDVAVAGATGFGWFPLIASTQPSAVAPVEEAVAAVARFLDALRARYAIDTAPLIVLGFSQGGVLAYRLALARPEAFSALVALSSWLPPALQDGLTAGPALSALPTLVHHGANDEVVAAARARQTVETLRQLGLPITYREYPIGHEISVPSLVDLSRWLEEQGLSRARPTGAAPAGGR